MSAIELVPRLRPFELACAFPSNRYLFGAATTIEDLSHHGIRRANPLFVPTKSAAVKLIIATHYWLANAYGHGNRAKRRQERLAANRGTSS